MKKQKCIQCKILVKSVYKEKVTEAIFINEFERNVIVIYYI